MPGQEQTVNLVAPEGGVYAVPASKVADALRNGWTEEGAGAAQERLTADVQEERYGGVGGALAAGAAGAVRGASLGTSDLIASVLGTQGDVDTLQNLREVNPNVSLGAEIGGAVVPSLLAGGSGVAGVAARATPAGAVSNLAARVATPAAEAGLAARAGRAVAGGAIEGAAGGAGGYLTEVALEDKPLSAEGFGAAMGKGALWGGAAGGALALSERALSSARQLFPKQAFTREAADEAESTFSRELGESMRDGDELARQADIQVEIATERAMTNPDLRMQILQARARKEAANADLAEQRLATARARAENPLGKAGKAAKPGLPDEQIAAAKVQINADMDAAMAAAPTPRSIDPADILGPGPARKASDSVTAPNPRPGATPPSDLEAALLGTKARLDAGEELGAISGAKAAARAEQEVAEIVAAADPQIAPLVRARAADRMARAEVDDWIASMRKRADAKAAKTGMSTGYRNTLEAGPFGAASRKTDKVNLPVGDDAAFVAQRAADDAYFDQRNARFAGMSDEALLADRQAKQAAGKARKAGGPVPQLADLSLAPGPGASVADDVADVLRGHVDVDAEDLARGIQVISNQEAAAAELVEAAKASGIPVPATAEARAAAYREAVDNAAGRQIGQAVEAGQQVKRAAATAEAARAAGTAKPGTTASIVGNLSDIGAAIELMQTLGIPGVPDVDKIPVIGPVLGWFLKARAASAAYRRLFGRGTMPQTAEGVIASRSARARERVVAAVDKMFDVGAKAAAKAQRGAPTAAAQLGHRLFEGDKDDSGGDPQKAYARRMDELARASQPGAIADSVRRRVRTGDPALLASIVEAQERKIAYLMQHAPKRPTPPTVLRGSRSKWSPSRAELQTFAAITEAVDSPVDVLERAAEGGFVSIEAAKAIRAVYPKLFAEAQRRLVERAADQDATPLPYKRRVQLSLLFDVPLDGTTAPEYLEYVQSAYAPLAAPAMPAPGQPPAPGIAADLSAVGQATATNLDARAGG